MQHKISFYEGRPVVKERQPWFKNWVYVSSGGSRLFNKANQDCKCKDNEHAENIIALRRKHYR